METERVKISTAWFGDGFELDAQAYKLRRGGRVLKLERIPLEVLVLLIEQRGQIVTRDQIVEKVWGKGVYLDTDNSINGAIRKIRQTLRDDAEQPRFVQTITGKGYRFIAPLNTGEPQPPAIEHALSPSALTSHTPRKSQAILVVLATLLVVGAVVTTYRHFRRAKSFAGQSTVVLSDFVNRTGDSAFDGTLRQALAVEFTQSPFVNVVSDLQVDEALRRMGRQPGNELTREVATEVCLRVNGSAILVGSISTLGKRYVVSLEALSCNNGSTLATSQAEANDKEGVLRTLDQLALDVRSRIGESLPSLQRYNFPANTTTNSLMALKAFSLGQEALRSSGEDEAIPFFQQAIELDPDFALAYAALGRAYENVGQDAAAIINFTKAYDLRNRLSERERYYITTLYYETVTGDLESAKTVGELWARTYPRDGYAHEKLGTVYADRGDIEDANAHFQEAFRLDPSSAVNLYNLVMATAALNRVEDAAQILKTARQSGIDGAIVHELIYSLAFLRTDNDEMDQQVVWATGKARGEDLILSLHSDTLAYYGKLTQADELSQRASQSARREKADEIAAICEIVAVLRRIETGNTLRAAESIRFALSLASTRDVKLLAALALARTGYATSARSLIRQVESANPTNTLVRFYWAPIIDAALQIHAGNPQLAIDVLRATAPYDLSQTSNLSNMWVMYPVYIRGQADLLQHEGKAAAGEFRKILEHSGMTQNSILGVLSRLQLARANRMMGDVDGARNEYRDFLFRWRNADPEIPLLKEAEAEYAQLQ